jgi:hypothetical protein
MRSEGVRMSEYASSLASKRARKRMCKELLSREPDSQFLKGWMLAALVSALVVALSHEFVQDGNVRGWLFLLVGVLVGLLQSIALQPWFKDRMRLSWTGCTVIGWAGAMLMLFLGSFLTLAGSGINNVSDEKIGQCLFETWAIAGALAGLPQGAAFPKLIFGPFLWSGVNALAWGLGGLLGGIVSVAVTETGEAWYASLVSTPGIFVAMLIYGAITGMAAFLVLRSRWRAGIVASSFDTAG